MILISIQISYLLSKLRNHSLKFRNQIDSDHMLATCYVTLTLCELSLLYLASVLSPKYVLMFLSLNNASHLEGYISSISFCVLF